MCGRRHPLLFTLMTLTAAAELGLTAFLISAGGSVGTWGSPRYRSLLILLFFEATWTLVFAAAYLFWVIHGGAARLANAASSVIWLLLTAFLWGAAAGFIHSSHNGGDCTRRGPKSRCRQSQTIEALGWIEFSLCILTLITTILWMTTGVRVRMKDSRTFV
ncbi:hypothetical protein PHLGIDRAFT_62657 [Phlebiopsis gigantea 11061_1 CR5-6]|uniref:MARVEL domain-containing protein n=1 Tax=Phlebiopsis gigantea (strain 11061_1 CR5-6) TaxID=745531 RepID=A0A0C3SFF0_PHLG1|nr:hypothetical protein PHLGIDRAFT_62657 [Phlebiopsis gigantea 11061_1 CR5-6]